MTGIVAHTYPEWWLKLAGQVAHWSTDYSPGKAALPDDWSTQDKFLIVVETASMNETDLAEYARKKGLYVEQIKAWRDACMNANGYEGSGTRNSQ